MTKLADFEWNDLCEKLSNQELPHDMIAHSIVQLGKPYDRDRIQRAKTAVLQYANDDDSWIRHEVLWFVGAWGRLQECLPVLIQAMHGDSFEDNRAYAANSIGVTMLGMRDPIAIKDLVNVLKNEGEESSVRLSAYGALLLTVKGKVADREADSFYWEEKGLGDIDWEWVNQLESNPSK